MRVLLLGCVLALASLGCGSNTPDASSTVAPPPDATATPEPPAGLSDEELAELVRERQQFGLRSDEAWIRAVAANPRSSSDFLGFPMLPEEAVEFQQRQEALSGVAGLVQRYTEEHPEDVAGLFIDQEHRRAVVLFTGNVEAHRAALAELIPGDDTLLDVRLARFSKAQLEALMGRIVTEHDWFRTIDAAFTGAGVDENANRVDLEISSANAAAPGLILEHFGVGPEALSISSDGTGIQLLPKGNVRGRVVNADGTPAGGGNLIVNWEPDTPGAGSGECGGGDIGYGVGDGGRFELPCHPGGWTISITDDSRPDRKEVGRGHVVVPPGQAVDVVITLDP